MVKREIDCDLNDIIGSYFRKKKCEKSLKLFYEKVAQTKNDPAKILWKFFVYLKEKKTDKENVKDDDLGFEINFGGYQRYQSALPVANRFNEQENLENKRSKIEGERKKKKEVPKEFIKKIKQLGMSIADAVILYETKIDWIAV